MREKNVEFLIYLQDLIEKRKAEMPANSYTSDLFREGINRIAQKVGEEAVELIIEAKDDNPDRFLNESADLIFQLLLLLSAKGHNIGEGIEILKSRHK